MKSLVFLTACCSVTVFSTHAFTTLTGTCCRTAHRSSSAATRLCSSTETKGVGNVQIKKEEPLSDLDARVLRDMLQNEKLDLAEEENMKKLLARGVAPKSAPSFQKEEPPDDTDSPYASTVLKTITDTKLWKNLKRDASNILETVGIFVSNRIERDAKLLASVGLFAWERAVRDASRALPSGGTSGAAVGRAVRQAARKLGNSSSYNDMQQQEKKRSLEEMDNLYQELNTPMDEIKSVTQSIRDILKGESVVTASSSRGLRSVAPAGQGQNAERQRRAYRRRKESTLQQEREVLNLQRAAGTVMDTAAEMRRELQVESSKPGYRTEGARRVIAAGAAETKRILEAAKKDGWSLALFGGSTERKEDNIRKLLVGSEDIETVKEEVDAQTERFSLFNGSTEVKEANVPEIIRSQGIETVKEEVNAIVVTQLLEEQSRVVERLSHALRFPSKTWLMPEVVKSGYDEDGLREVVTAMICARDDLEVTDGGDASLSASEMVEKLRKVKSTVDSISSLAAACAGVAAAERLSSFLYGQEEEDASIKPPLLLTLDDVEASIAAAVQVAESLPKVDGHVRIADSEIHSDTVVRTVFAEVLSDVTDRVVSEVVPPQRPSPGQEIDVTEYHKQMVEMTSSPGGTSKDANVRMASVELISDDDFDSAFSGAKSVAVADIDEEEDKEADDGFVGVVLLRGLDVLFFVLEKLFTTAIPNAFKVGSTVTTRLADVAREGMGSRGWKKLENTQTGSKRY